MSTFFSSKRSGGGFRISLALFILGRFAATSWGAAETPRVFSTPQEAITALGQAIDTTNRVALAALFGPASESLVNPDTVQSALELTEFKAAFNATNHLARESETRMILEVGVQAWPFPIPLIKTNGVWQFDALSGLEEVLNRRIGRNELEVLGVMRAAVEAQREYASKDRDGDDVLEYAQKLTSSPGLTDGLFWPPGLNGEVSPLGPLVARAQGVGYFRGPSGGVPEPRPFHGYLFKMLTRQGKHAPGGKYDYIINGNMIGGFALVAWPMEYGDSGVMTFIVNHRGRVYERDLGPKTAETVRKMNAYDPSPEWQLSSD